MNKKSLALIVLAAVVALGAIGFWFYRDTIFSKEIVRLEILGPDHAKMGEEIEYTVTYKNNGNFVLESPKLVFELPENSLTEDGKKRLTQSVADLYPGDEKTTTFKARLLGKENDIKTAHAWLSYVPHNLSVRYERDATLSTNIDAVPLTLEFDLPTKIETGKEITYSINYFSNIDYPLENISIKVDAVQGFQVTSAVPKSLDNAEWKLAVLNKSEGGKITIKGLVNGDTGSTMHFVARLGMWVNGVFVPIKESDQEVQVIEPLLFISQQVNGSSNYSPVPGEILHYEIFFRNISSTSFDNLFVMSDVKGSGLDVSTLRSPDGQTRPNDNLVVWDSRQIPRLAHIAPQQEVRLEFTIKLKDSWLPADSEKNNTVIKNTVTAADISQEFLTKVSSRLDVSQSVQKAGTSYQITWQPKNYLNDVRNVKIKAMLPTGVSLDDFIMPESEAANFSFDTASRQLVWFVGDLGAGAGVANASKQLSIQVSAAAFGTLANQVIIMGEDAVTGIAIQTNIATLLTN